MRSSDQTTIHDGLDAFLADAASRRGLSANTLRAYRYDLRAAGAALTRPISAITAPEIERFLAERPDEQPSTTNRRRASLSRFFRWAQRQGLRADNPVALVESKREEVSLPRPIPAGDLRTLDAMISVAPHPYRLAFTILRETGMRADEVLSLDVGDICLDAGREGLRVREAKSRHDRTVVLAPDQASRSLRGLRAALRRLGISAPHVPLFQSNRGTRLSYDSLHYQWAKVCAQAGLLDDGQPRYTLHQLRHTVATDLIADLPEHIVSRVLGHRDPRSTRRYAEVNDDQVRSALAGRRQR
jgi:integrase/recombinase XerD